VGSVRGPELVDGDWNDAAAIERALESVDGAFVMLPAFGLLRQISGKPRVSSRTMSRRSPKRRRRASSRFRRAFVALSSMRSTRNICSGDLSILVGWIAWRERLSRGRIPTQAWCLLWVGNCRHA